MTCKDCIHCKVCHLRIVYRIDTNEGTGKLFDNMEKRCEYCKGKLHNVELPCMPHQIVFADARILNTEKLSEHARALKIISCFVTNIRYDGTMKAKIYLTPMNNSPFSPKYHIFVNENAIGKTVFLNKSEAEQKLKELKENA